ncbi:MAG: pyridoxal-phosphate-dependent aminotransferase family protein [Nitrospinota bacterium]
MIKKEYLISPGPTPVPEEVLLAMSKAAIHHRTPKFSKVFKESAANLKELFQTKNDVLILASSGTGAMEASISNLFSVGDKVLVINGGKFGERWGDIATAYGLNVVRIDLTWGTAVSVEQIKIALEKDPDIEAILVQASETSTTVRHPIDQIASLTKESDRLLIVDGITSVGVEPLNMDELGIDILLTGSQKALMLPPGLAMISLSDKAWSKSASSKLPKYYFNLAKERKNLKSDTSAYTPATSLIFGLQKALEMILTEGLENVYARHELLATAVRAGGSAIGLKMLAPDSPANSATAFITPEEIDGALLVKNLRDKYGVTFAGGQNHLKGKIIRIAHLGYFDKFDMIIALAAIEMGLVKAGYKLTLGKAVAAAMTVLNNES